MALILDCTKEALLALNLYVYKIVPELVDERLHVFELHLLVFNFSAISFSALNSDLLKSVVVTAIVIQFFVEKMNNFIASHVQKLSGVRHDNNCTFAVANIVLEPHDSVQIQVIGWFVQQKNLRFDEEGSGQGDSHSPTSGKRADRFAQHVRSKAETSQNNRGS